MLVSKSVTLEKENNNNNKNIIYSSCGILIKFGMDIEFSSFLFPFSSKQTNKKSKSKVTEEKHKTKQKKIL